MSVEAFAEKYNDLTELAAECAEFFEFRNICSTKQWTPDARVCVVGCVGRVEGVFFY